MKSIYKILFLCCFWLFASNLHAQRIAEKVEEIKLSNIKESKVSLLSPNSTYRRKAVPKEFESAKYFNFDKTAAKRLIEEDPGLLNIDFDLGNGKTVTAELINARENMSNFSVVVRSGKKFNAADLNASFYRGVIKGDEKNSLVSLTVFEDEIAGVISTGNRTFVVGKMKDASEHVIYDDANYFTGNPLECGTVNEPLNESEQSIYDDATTSLPTETNRCIGLYYETEFDIFQTHGSVSGVVSWVTALHNDIATIYANELITVEISEINVWDVPDPYNSTSSSGSLSQFQANTGTFNGELGQLFTGRSVGGGIAAGFSGLCNSNPDESLCFSGSMTSNNTPFPTYSWNLMVASHEFGHLFGSRHTHACVWNGNNTAIDGCAGGTEGSCPTPGNPPGGGTIMSYCAFTSVGTNFSNGFGLQPGNVIRANVNNASCAASCCDDSDSPNFDIEINCNNGNFSVTVTALDTDPANHWWGLMETTVEGSTAGSDTVDGDPGTPGNDPVAPIQSGTTATFSWLDLSKHYYIKHGIWTEGCYTWREVRIPVPEFEATAAFHFEDKNGNAKDEFCYGDDIYIDGAASQDENRYYIDAWRRPIGTSGSFNWYGAMGWTLNAQVGTVNISNGFAANGVTFQPGYEYRIKLAVMNLDECMGWTEVVHEFTLECCGAPDASFDLIVPSAGGGTYTIAGINAESYSNIGAQHGWYVLSSPNPSGGPYTPVSYTTGTSLNFTGANDGLYYFVVHKVKTLCGEACYGQSICMNCEEGRVSCGLCGPIDCALIDEEWPPCSPQTLSPTFSCRDGKFSWNAVPEADGYIVQVTWNDPTCCKTGYKPTSIQLKPTGKAGLSATLSFMHKSGCFSYRIGVICDEVTTWSQKYCVNCRYKEEVEHEDTKKLQSGDLAGSSTSRTLDIESLSLNIAPNPTSGQVTINIASKEQQDGALRVFSSFGQLLRETTVQTNSNTRLDLSDFPAGVYIVQFQTGNETPISKRLVLSR